MNQAYIIITTVILMLVITKSQAVNDTISDVSPNCLKCICRVESNCRIPRPLCHVYRGYDTCGPYNINKKYWTEARSRGRQLGTDWITCTIEMGCSERAVQGYMARYAIASRLGHEPTCEDQARIHNGGPYGFRMSSTLSYWHKVEMCLKYRN
ncbi:lysozyme 1-like [Anneissia japonica]|uniref:lysozyme 1-like n=1 Tax=Anneissia japonica TaxID=1529436 RepID=UPI001425AA11|nr:lysozyme 1-like [Anneissia japonica]